MHSPFGPYYGSRFSAMCFPSRALVLLLRGGVKEEANADGFRKSLAEKREGAPRLP